MIYSREFDEFCIKLSLHFPIDGVGIKVGKARFYFTLGALNLNILYMCHFCYQKILIDQVLIQIETCPNLCSLQSEPFLTS